MKYISKLTGILALALLTFSCVKEKQEVLAPGTFEIDTDEFGSIALEQFKQVVFIPVKTNIAESEWKISSSADWCKAGYSMTAAKGLMIAVEENTDKERQRQAEVSVQAGANNYKIQVVQTGYGPAIIVSNVTVGPEGGDVSMEIVSNVEIDEESLRHPRFNKDDGEDWIVYLEKTKAFATTRYTFRVGMNELPDKREARVSVKAKDSADSAADTECVITQNSISADPHIFSDKQLEVLSVKANQTSAYEGPAENLVDGNYFTYYHSPYEVPTTFPVVWEFELDGQDRLDYLCIMHRAYGTAAGTHPRGQVGEFNVYYKTAADNNYVFAQKFDFGGNGGYQTANLSKPIQNPTWIKIEVLSGDPNSASGSDGSYITCGEVEFFNTNRFEVNEWIGRIFTDLSCSELRSGVTRQDIIQMNAVSPYLASKVAIPLLNGSYDANEKDFRIHSYEPYADNRVNRALVTRIYSAMNNPTGIEVKSGDEILVCVDQIPAGQSVSLAVYGDREDGTGPNYGGGGENEGYDQNTELQAGINTVRISADGMAYVMNTIVQADPLHPSTTPVSSYKSVKVHILPGCGTVQGYYDPSRHSEERYKELLNRCTTKYFLIKGKKVIFLFSINQLRSDFPNSFLSGSQAWDDILGWQHELMGLDKKTWFNNHMMAVSSTNPDVYMDASHRRVQFNANTLSKIGSREALIANEGGWGPCHEMGHVNQQAINWKSSTESSNNLFSNYCVMRLAGDEYYKTSFSRGKKISDLARDFADARPWALLGDGSYQNEDPELHMRMNWQLWNYYHNCGVKPDFWPTLFEYLRQHPLPSEMAPSYYGRSEDAGASQLEFYEAACIAAGQDLTEFFDAWGFFIPIDRQYEQYGSVLYRVTEAMINASRARVRDMKLPKAAPIQYLEDRTKVNGELYSEMGYYTQYRDKVTITKTPKATVNGRKVTLTDCDQAVAVEVRRGNADTGELLYFSNLFNFEVPASVSLGGNTLWAVQADGKRVKVQQ